MNSNNMEERFKRYSVCHESPRSFRFRTHIKGDTAACVPKPVLGRQIWVEH